VLGDWTLSFVQILEVIGIMIVMLEELTKAMLELNINVTLILEFLTLEPSASSPITPPVNVLTYLS
jgi:hypothetical protein